MIPVLIGFALVGIALAFSALGSYFDLKTGEIPDKFTIGLVITALGVRAAASLIYGDLGFQYLLDGLIAGGVYFGIGYMMFFTGGWGGGDAKLLAGIGASVGGAFPALSVLPTPAFFPALMLFFVSMAFISIPYAMGYSIILSFRHRKVFSVLKGQFKANLPILMGLSALSAALIILFKPWNALLVLGMLSPILFYLMLMYVRAVEQVALRKRVSVAELEEEDLVAEDIAYKGKTLVSHRDMDGVSKEALAKIRKLAGEDKIPKTIVVKWGIKFGPVFPLALGFSFLWPYVMAVLV